MKFGRKLIALLTTTLLVFGGIPSAAFAAPSGPYVCTGFGQTYTIYATSGQHTVAEIYLRNESTGQTITTFCADMTREVSSGNRYTTVSTLTNNYIRAILYANPSSLVPGISYADRIKGTQAAIWHYSDNLQLSMNDSRNSANMRALYNALLALPPMGPVGDTQQAVATVELTGITRNSDGTVNASFRFKSSVSSVGLTPSITQGSGVIGPVTENGGWKEVTVSNIPANGTFTLTVSGQQTIKYDARFLYSQGRQTLVGFPHDESVTISGTSSIQFGSLRIRKAFTAGQASAGDRAQSFPVTVSGQYFSLDVNVPGNGNWVTVSGLPYGSYTVTENLTSGQQALYRLETITSGGNVTVSGSQTNVTVTNRPLGSLSITKDLAKSGEADGTEFSFHITGPGFGESGQDFTLSDGETAQFDKLPYGTYVISEARIDGYELTGFTGGGGSYNSSAGTYTLTIGANNRTVAVTAQNKKLYGYIKVIKDDGAGNKLSGAEFTISRDGSVVDTLVTNDAGEATSKALPLGSYLLAEAKAPAGYAITFEPVIVVVAADGSVYTYTVSNRLMTGYIKVVKDDGAGNKLAGAEFTITDADGNVVDTLVTDDAGEAVSNALPLGTYTLTETKAPEGYAITFTPVTVTVGEDGRTYTYEISNRRMAGYIKVVKDDGAGNKLAGAEFTITDADGNVADTLVTNDAGEATSQALPLGTYTLTETKAPEGYAITFAPATVEVREDGQTYTYEISNRLKTGYIKVVKSDGAGNKLGGAVFAISRGGSVVDTLVTNASGEATSKALPLGTYTLTETKAPAGYAVTFAPATVVVSEDGRTYTYEISNRRMAGYIKVVKDDGAGNKLAGAEFTITDADGNIADTLVTNDAGEATSQALPLGTYTLTETKAPAGYAITFAPVTVDVSADGQTYTYDISNEQLFGSAVFLKDVNNVSGDATPFTLNIYKDGSLYDTVTVSEAAGPVTLNNLPFGSYTVQEAAAEGYENVLISPSSFVIDENNYSSTPSVTVTATNHKLFGSAMFRKEVDNVSGDPTVFRLNITGPNGYSNQVDVTDEGAAVTLVDLPFGHYTVSEVAVEGYAEVGISPREFDIGTDNYGSTPSVTVTATNHKIFGYIKVVKDDGAGIKLAGAEFEIKDAGGNVVETLVTNDAGEATSQSLPYGTYTLTETKAPYGYAIDNPAPITVTVSESEYVYTYTFHNTRLLGSASFAKAVDNVPGDTTVFTLAVTGDNGYYNTVQVGGGITGASLWDLPFGTYTVTELETSGYRNVSIVPDTFVIDETNYQPALAYMTSVSVLATNHKLLGWIQVLKKDANDDTKFLAGAEFQISTADGDDFEANIVETITTGADGTATTGPLPEGTYYVRESKAPEGYVIDDDSIRTATVTDGVTFVVSPAFTDTKYEGWIAVTKLDAQTKLPVAGVIFQLLDRNPNTDPDFTVLDEQATDETGKAYFRHLVPGVTYYVREIQQAPGYDINVADVHAVTVIFNDEAPTQFENNEIGRLRIAKADSRDGSPLAGAVFQVSSSLEDFDNHIVETLTTGADGTATSGELIVGTYWVKEVTAPDGYLIDNPDPVEVVVPFNDTLTVGPFTDTRNLGAVVIKKVDALNPDKTLAGAEFALFTDMELTNQVGDSVITGADGIARFDNLEPGTYWIMELAAPKDYEKMAAPIDVVVTGGVFEPDPIVFTNQYNPPEDYQTGTMSWTLLLVGAAALLAGAMLVLFARKRRKRMQ